MSLHFQKKHMNLFMLQDINNVKQAVTKTLPEAVSHEGGRKLKTKSNKRNTKRKTSKRNTKRNRK